MDTKNDQLTLVSFATPQTFQAIQQTLSRLGFTAVAIPGEEWLVRETGLLKGLVVLLLDDRTYLREKILSILMMPDQAPVLAVFCGDVLSWDPNILDACGEFVVWPCDEKELAIRLERLRPRRGGTPVGVEESRLIEEFAGFDMIGQSPAFVEVLKLIKKVAPCDAPVLIEGETGTGKELAARAIHNLSSRRDHPFIALNCGAIPDNLLENELFGHERGAFTDAREAQPGVVAQADRGTLFLDEVDALSAKAQVALLRFLQDQEYRPLGSKRARKADVRIIAASNVSLQQLVEKDLFRQDLLFRLNIMSIALPALRERASDIELLAKYFVRQYRARYNQPEKYLQPAGIRWLQKYDWPGNIRELENVIHREFLFAEGPAIYITSDLHPAGDRQKTFFTSWQSDFYGVSFGEAKAKVIAEFEEQYLCWLMAESEGNVTLAAKRAGKERRALGKLLKKHAIK